MEISKRTVHWPLRGLARAITLSFSLAAASTICFAQATPDVKPDAKPDIVPKEILERADEVRFPKGGFETEIRITSTKPGEEKEERKYRVLSRGSENSIVQVLEPEVDRGQSILMRGRDLWLYVPDVSQPVRLSLAQRLTGQVANGDLARANFSADYEGTLLRTEPFNGSEHLVLELLAKERSVTYAKVIAWINRANNHPSKAEFYAVSGKLLKTASYQNYKTILGRLRPTRLVLVDAVKAGEESVMEYQNMKSRDLPDRMFTKEYLRKLDQ